MTLFIVILVCMTAAALAWVLPPLMRRRTQDGVAGSASNLALLRDQAAELDADLRNGTIAADQHTRARAELERRVLDEAAVAPQGSGAKSAGRWPAVVVGIAIPVLALGFYLHTGTPEALAPRHGDASLTPEQVEQMVKKLAARLEANPEDPNGWALLGRSYYALGRFGEAVKAYARAVQLTTDDAGLYADYADALAMTQDRRVDENVLALVNHALKINPDHLKALALAGGAAFERKDYKAAAGYLERIQRQIPPDSELGRMVAERVEQARALAQGSGSDPQASAKGKSGSDPKSEGTTIRGRVALSAELKGKAAPSDTVFILARAAEGPRMPLAILKRQVKDLPVEFTLGDEQAMSPEMRLSKFREVVIVVRVSKSGGAAPQSGDLEGATKAIKVGASGVNVVIDTIVP